MLLPETEYEKSRDVFGAHLVAAFTNSNQQKQSVEEPCGLRTDISKRPNVPPCSDDPKLLIR